MKTHLRGLLIFTLLLGTLSARATDVVNNTANASTGQLSSIQGKLAQAFETGAVSAPLQGIAMRLTSFGNPQPSFQLWSSAGAVPDKLLETVNVTQFGFGAD